MSAGEPAEGPASPLDAEVLAFLRETPPFGQVPEGELRELAAAALLDYFPKGHRILAQGGPPSEALHLVVTGGVRVSIAPGDGGAVRVDYRSAGDAVGYLSLSSGDISRADVVAAEDTECYLLPREPFLRLIASHPPVREYFDRAFLGAYLDRAFEDMRARSLLVGGGERLLFTTPVGDAVRRPAVTAPRGTSVRDGAGIMSRSGVSSLVLLDADGSPAGILTDSDLRARIAAAARDPALPAAEVMTRDLVTIDAGAPCFEALLTMVRGNIHHLVVTDGGRLRGVVTNHDLMLAQGNSPISVVRQIEACRDVEGLAQAVAAVDELVVLLVREGAKADSVARIVAEIDDRLVRRLAALAVEELGAAPLPWCWLAHGRPGRRERTFRGPQRNALVLGGPTATDGAAAAWSERFAASMADGLRRCGFPASSEDPVAANPLWRLTLDEWVARGRGWIGDPGEGLSPDALGFLDFRPVVGDAGLAGSLRESLAAAVASPAGAAFLDRAAAAAAAQRPPLGTFGSVVVEHAGGRRAQLDLDRSGIRLIVDLVRVCALEGGAGETGTLERLRALGGLHPLVTALGSDLERAFEFLSLLQVTHGAGRRGAGAPWYGPVDLGVLGAHERTSLRDAFRLIARAQDLLAGGRGR